MTWQTGIYFSSIVLTCLLTGFLAWFAWHQPNVPGARSYAYMVLAESLLAITEICTMLAGTEPQAAFWFSLRVPFAAIIPVFWLFFAMEYNGRGDWFSKPLRAVLFAIPLITLVVMVTSGLHGLWLVHDVAFEKIGPFWIADTSARIPGLWYLVHTFYSTLLLIVGAGVLVAAAWRKPKLLRGQALLVSLGALTALGLALNGVFNLLPQLPFNLFVPGIGFSAVCYALAIFRFQFLKHPPTQEDIKRVTNLATREKYSLANLVLIFIIFVASIAAIGYLTYQNYEMQFRTQVGDQLASVANLKVTELQAWRSERLADGQILGNNATFAALVRAYFEDPQAGAARAELQTWLNKYQVYGQYDRVRLLDLQGATRLSTPQNLPPLSPEILQRIPDVLESRQVTLVDFYRDEADQHVYLNVLIPILDASKGSQVAGLVSLRIDPQAYLYPYIIQWPGTSATAETLLVRREEEDALYLNDLKFEPGSALNLRISLENTNVLAVRAVLGESGLMEGTDYRGVAVIGYARPVLDSPWFLVARIDEAEVYAPLTTRAWQTVGFFGVLILAAGTGLTLIWRQQRLSYYRAQMGTLNALRASEEKFKKAFLISPDSVVITRLADGVFVSANQGFTQILGYTEAEVLGKSSLEINLWENPQDRKNIVAALQEKGQVQNYEARFRTKQGSTIYGLMSAVIIELDGEAHILNTTRDITKRKQAEETLIQVNDRLALAQRLAGAGVWDWDFTTGKLGWTPEFFHLLGLDPAKADATFDTWRGSLHPADVQSAEQRINDAVRDHVPLFNEYRIITPSGETRWIGAWGDTAYNERGEAQRMTGLCIDITERKQAEERLRESEKLLAEIAANYPNSYLSIIEKDLTVGFTSGQEFKKLGLNPADFIGLTLEQVFGEHAPLVRENYLKTFGGQETIFELFINAQYQLYRAVPLVSEDGEVKRILSVVENITERKQAEAALQESEQKYRLLFDEMLSGFAVHEILCDEDGNPVDYRFLAVNLAFERMTGLKAADILGRTVKEIMPGTEPAWINIYGHVALTREAAQFEDYAGALGKHFEVRAFSPEPGKFATIFNDITERKQAEETLQQYSARLEADVVERTHELREAQEKLVRQERLAVLGQLAGSVGHELRNPLGVISNAAYFLKMIQPKADEKTKEYLQIIENETRTAEKIITDLLDFARIKNMDRQPVDVAALVEKTLERYPLPAGVTVSRHLGRGLPPVLADLRQMTQVLGNLLTNASQAMEEKGKITLSARRAGEMVSISMTDSGPGISPENMKKIFEPLFTTKIRGIGLGLAVSQRFVEANGGRLEVQSASSPQGEAGKGATFTVSLPIYKESHE